MVITGIIPVYYNTCDPTCVGRLVLCRTRCGDHTCCGDEVLREFMVQMAINPFVNVTSMTNLLKKVLPGKRYVDRHMINNVRICARRKS